uniref:Uncharacterized protein n=1 Tax=Hyaloperonospora arabidopsidis (strain Emoy2) TaxID=559515 RepID=M4B273_HYAAE
MRHFRGSTFLVSSVRIRTFIIIHAVHERSCSAGIRHSGISWIHIIGKPVLDRASRATAFPFWRMDFRFHIIINNDHSEVQHGDPFVSLLKVEQVIVEVINMLVKLAWRKRRHSIAGVSGRPDRA